VSYTTAGNAIFNARQGQHDELVLALALAVFWCFTGKVSNQIEHSDCYVKTTVNPD
jgi:hypothetical protein